ncbi:MAG: polyprenyl synthetase family protein [Atopobiaceae bacterium]|jgi:geranylgeranyl diphosphate synthase type I
MMSDLSAFTGYLAAHRPEVDDALARSHAAPMAADPYGVSAAGQIERYLTAPLAAYSANGGKRTRPLICLLACEAVGGRREGALSAACAIEDFQTAALIHDDIADKGELRRGRPCLHLTEGLGVAINCGDEAINRVTMLILADRGLDDGRKVRVIGELCAMIERTCEGQALDLGWARDGRWDVSVDDYLAMATHKTAFYSGGTPLAVGAIVGGGTEEQVEALRSFGMDSGLAFQIQDDLLNLVGSAEAAGKDFRSDITEGKRTLVAVHALASAGAAERAELLGILEGHSDDPARLARAVEIMEGTGSLHYARACAERLAEGAKATLSSVELREGPREALLEMADFFVERHG